MLKPEGHRPESWGHTHQANHECTYYKCYVTLSNIAMTPVGWMAQVIVRLVCVMPWYEIFCIMISRCKICYDLSRCDKYTQICYVFIMCHSFLIQAHGAIKYVVKYVLLYNICASFCQNIAFLYHDIPFVYSDILHLIYHLCISRLSWDFISWHIVYYNYRGITSYWNIKISWLTDEFII